MTVYSDNKLIEQNVTLAADLSITQSAVKAIASEIRAQSLMGPGGAITLRIDRRKLSGWASALDVLAGTLPADGAAATMPAAGATSSAPGPGR